MKNSLTPIHDFLCRYSECNYLRCHMPGGKGLQYPHDITEIFGGDSLYESSGIIRESEENAARLFKTGATAFSTQGATLPIMSMLALLKTFYSKGGARIAAGRYSHRSLIDSAVLLDLEITWIYPFEYLSADISPDMFNNINCDGIFLSAIDYYGGECDIKAFAEIAKLREIPFFVDNAHGAYNVFTNSHPIRLGADFSADSAHKTLPSITGGGYLHMADKNFLAPIKEAMSLFGSSSPSYLILESLDLCNLHIQNEKIRAKTAFQLVGELKKRLSDLGFSLKNSDSLRITVNTREWGYSGIDFAALLREKRLECEMADDTYVVLLFSTITGESEILEVEEAFKKIKIKSPLSKTKRFILKPKAVVSPRTAFFSKKEKVLLNKAQGRICAEIISPCPPGVPLIMPGEVFDNDAIEELAKIGVFTVMVIR